MLRRFILATGLIAFQAHAGISTNGAAFQMEEDNVWFLGSRQVEYCIEKNSSSNGLSASELQTLIKESFADWKAFLQTYGLDKIGFQHLKDEKHPKLALDFKHVETCTKPEEQIQFLFGVVNTEVSDALENQEGSIALNVRGVYNHDTYRNGGFIYVADIPLTKARLRHVILHEIGHIFGFPHDSVYVMNSSIAYDLSNKEISESSFGRIESPTWKYRLATDSKIQFSDSSTFTFDRKSMTGELTTRGTVLKGHFQVDPAFATVNLGPRIHLVMLCSECLYEPDCRAFCGSNSYGVTKYLDPESPFGALTGTLSDGTSISPATIVNSHGTHLRVFDPKSGAWKVFD